LTFNRDFNRERVFVIILSLLLLLLFVLSLALGTISLSLTDIVHILLPFYPGHLNPIIAKIIIDIRLPRILMAMVVGASLGIAGSKLQTILRNPLASPYTIGIASASAFGAALAIVLGAGIIGWYGTYFIILNPYAIAINAFTFAVIGTIFIALMAFRKGASPTTIILSGIATTFMFSAATSLLQYFGTSEQVTALVFWMFGDLGKANWIEVEITTISLLITFTIVLLLTPRLDALVLGDEVAETLGIRVKLCRIVMLLLASLLTAVPVAFVGTIGFIGLLAPHISRFLVGPIHRHLIPISALVGAELLLAADTASRLVLSPLILPVGILTAFMGVPLFLYLLFSRGAKEW